MISPTQFRRLGRRKLLQASAAAGLYTFGLPHRADAQAAQHPGGRLPGARAGGGAEALHRGVPGRPPRDHRGAGISRLQHLLHPPQHQPRRRPRPGRVHDERGVLLRRRHAQRLQGPWPLPRAVRHRPQPVLHGAPTRVYQGKTYAVPEELDIMGLAYNKDLFDEAGVNPTADWNWDNLLDAATKLTRTTDDGRQTYGVYAMNNIRRCGAISSEQNGGTFPNPQHEAGRHRHPQITRRRSIHSGAWSSCKVSPSAQGVSSLPGYIQVGR